MNSTPDQPDVAPEADSAIVETTVTDAANADAPAEAEVVEAEAQGGEAPATEDAESPVEDAVAEETAAEVTDAADDAEAETVVETVAEPEFIEPDPSLFEAKDLALAALREITPESTIGPPADYRVEAGGVVSLRFENRLAGYPGWYWTVSVARVEGSEPTVLELELLPGEGALLAPEWTPWAVRLADYHAAQAALAAIAEEEESDLDDEEDDDDEDFESDESSILHAGDVDGVDIDSLDDDADDDDDSDDDDSDEDDDDDDEDVDSDDDDDYDDEDDSDED